MQENLDEVKKWVNDGHVFWDKFIGYALKENSNYIVDSQQIAKKRQEIAEKLSELVIMDISKRDKDHIEKYDIIQSNFCLESATDDISEYKRMLKNCYHYLKPDGILLVSALEGAVAYKIGKKLFPAIYLDKQLVSKYFVEAGFKIEKIEKVLSDDSDNSKYHGILFIKAIKD